MEKGLEVFNEREISAIYEENVGNPYIRAHRIAERAFEAKLRAAEKIEPLCPFRNKYGWCKLAEGHEGSHTVVFLGKEDEWED